MQNTKEKLREMAANSYDNFVVIGELNGETEIMSSMKPLALILHLEALYHTLIDDEALPKDQPDLILH